MSSSRDLVLEPFLGELGRSDFPVTPEGGRKRERAKRAEERRRRGCESTY